MELSIESPSPVVGAGLSHADAVANQEAANPSERGQERPEDGLNNIMLDDGETSNLVPAKEEICVQLDGSRPEILSRSAERAHGGEDLLVAAEGRVNGSAPGSTGAQEREAKGLGSPGTSGMLAVEALITGTQRVQGDIGGPALEVNLTGEQSPASKACTYAKTQEETESETDTETETDNNIGSRGIAAMPADDAVYPASPLPSHGLEQIVPRLPAVDSLANGLQLQVPVGPENIEGQTMPEADAVELGRDGGVASYLDRHEGDEVEASSQDAVQVRRHSKAGEKHDLLVNTVQPGGIGSALQSSISDVDAAQPVSSHQAPSPQLQRVERGSLVQIKQEQHEDWGGEANPSQLHPAGSPAESASQAVARPQIGSTPPRPPTHLAATHRLSFSPGGHILTPGEKQARTSPGGQGHRRKTASPASMSSQKLQQRSVSGAGSEHDRRPSKQTSAQRPATSDGWRLREEFNVQPPQATSHAPSGGRSMPRPVPAAAESADSLVGNVPSPAPKYRSMHTPQKAQPPNASSSKWSQQLPRHKKLSPILQASGQKPQKDGAQASAASPLDVLALASEKRLARRVANHHEVRFWLKVHQGNTSRKKARTDGAGDLHEHNSQTPSQVQSQGRHPVLERLLQPRQLAQAAVKQESSSTTPQLCPREPPARPKASDLEQRKAGHGNSPAEKPLKRLMKGSKQSNLRSAPAKQKEPPGSADAGPGRMSGGNAKVPHTAPAGPMQKNLPGVLEEARKYGRMLRSAVLRETKHENPASQTGKRSAEQTGDPLKTVKKCRTVLTFDDEDTSPRLKGPSAQKRDRSRQRPRAGTQSTVSDPRSSNAADESSALGNMTEPRIEVTEATEATKAATEGSESSDGAVTSSEGETESDSSEGKTETSEEGTVNPEPAADKTDVTAGSSGLQTRGDRQKPPEPSSGKETESSTTGSESSEGASDSSEEETVTDAATEVSEAAAKGSGTQTRRKSSQTVDPVSSHGAKLKSSAKPSPKAQQAVVPTIKAEAGLAADWQVTRASRVRKPPVAFWACERAVIDPVTGTAAVDAPFQDHLRFGQATVQTDGANKQVVTVKLEDKKPAVQSQTRSAAPAKKPASKKAQPLPKPSPAKEKLISKPNTAPSISKCRQQPKPQKVKPAAADSKPPAKPSAALPSGQIPPKAKRASPSAANSPRQKPQHAASPARDLLSIAAIAMAAGKAAADASPHKKAKPVLGSQPQVAPVSEAAGKSKAEVGKTAGGKAGSQKTKGEGQPKPKKVGAASKTQQSTVAVEGKAGLKRPVSEPPTDQAAPSKKTKTDETPAENPQENPSKRRGNSGLGVFPRCAVCREKRPSRKYCGTDTAIKDCLNWPPKQPAAIASQAQARAAASTALANGKPSKPQPAKKAAQQGKANAQSRAGVKKQAGKASKPGKLANGGTPTDAMPQLPTEPQKTVIHPDQTKSTALTSSEESDTESGTEAASEAEAEGVQLDGWSKSQLSALQAAWLREVDPTAKGFWQRVARLVPGGKTADDCHQAYMQQFGSTPAEKPKRAASQKTNLVMQAQQGKKPTKVAVRKMARQARWQQQVEQAGSPSGSEDSASREQRLEEVRIRRAKADRYIDMLLRKRGKAAGFRMQWGTEPPQRVDRKADSDSYSQIASMLGNETSQMESDEDSEKDDYFSDESEI